MPPTVENLYWPDPCVPRVGNYCDGLNEKITAESHPNVLARSGARDVAIFFAIFAGVKIACQRAPRAPKRARWSGDWRACRREFRAGGALAVARFAAFSQRQKPHATALVCPPGPDYNEPCGSGGERRVKPAAENLPTARYSRCALGKGQTGAQPAAENPCFPLRACP